MTTLSSMVQSVQLSTAQEWSATQNFNRTTLTWGATQAWDLILNQVTQVTLAGNTTFSLPTGIVDGAYYSIKVGQDATGGRTGSWNTAFHFIGAAAPILSTAANAIDTLTFQGVGTTELHEVDRSLNT